MARRGTLIAYVRRADGVVFPDGVARSTLLVPSSWTLRPEACAPPATLASVWPLGIEGSSVIGGQVREHRDVFFHAYMMVPHASLQRALFVLVGHPYVLARVSDMVASDALSWTRTWANLADFRADATTLAQQVRASWPVEHTDGGVVRLLARVAGYDEDDAESNT
jgi:hypothetical protein